VSAFTGVLTITEYHAAEYLWAIEQPLIYEVGELGSGQIITVPPGYITDGASIPRYLWVFLPSWGKYSRAAVVHDFLCTLLDRGVPHPQAPTRRDADVVFYEAMGVCKVSLPVRLILWAGVRLGAILPGHPPNYRYDEELPLP
jgi:hypothetical protein